MNRLLFGLSLFQIGLFAEIGDIDISSNSHNIGVSSNLNTLKISWSQPTTDGDILQKYRWKFDLNSSSNLEDDIDAKEIVASSNSLEIPLDEYQDGEYYFHILAITEEGDSGVDWGFGKIILDRTPPPVEIVNIILEDQSVEISLKSTENGTSIYYTLDEIEPTAQSIKFETPFKIYSSKVIKFIVMDSAGNWSEVSEKSIFVNYSGNIVQFTNIEDGEIIATTSLNGASNITPQIVVTSSNLATYRYKFDSEIYSELVDKDSSIDITRLSDGSHTLYARGSDQLGNRQIEESSIIFTVDNSAPKYIYGYIDNIILGDRNIFATGKSLTLFADENALIRYTIDGDTPSKTFGKIYNQEIVVTNDLSLKMVAYDSLGNIGNIENISIIIDRENPSLPKIFDKNKSELNSSNIAFYQDSFLYDRTQNFSFTSSDNQTQTPTIFWTLDGKTPTILNSDSGNVSVTSTSTLQFIAVDEVNNSTKIQRIDFVIDSTAPKSLSSTLSEGCINKDAVYNCIHQNIEIQLIAIDNETPDNLNIYYTQNGELPDRDDLNIESKENVSLILTQNEKTFKYVAYDKVGNRSETKIVRLRYDIEAVNSFLEIIASLSIENGVSINSKNIRKVDVTISNGGNTVFYYYKLDSGDFIFESNISQSIDISNLSDGNHTLKVIASNGELNSTENSITFKVDNTAPSNPIISGITSFADRTTVLIEIADEDNDTKVYYSLNGATPSIESFEYSESFNISETLIVRTFAIDNVGNRSGEVSKTFTKIISISDTNNTDGTDNPDINETIPDTEEPETPDENPDTENPNTPDDSNIVDVVLIVGGEKLTIENSDGNLEYVEINYPKGTTFSDDGDKSFAFESKDIFQNITVSQSGDILTTITKGREVLEINSTLNSQTVSILENGEVLIKNEPVISDSGKRSNVEIRISSKEIEINLIVDGKNSNFPTINLDGESANISISLQNDNSINIELEVPLSYKNLIF